MHINQINTNNIFNNNNFKAKNTRNLISLKNDFNKTNFKNIEDTVTTQIKEDIQVESYLIIETLNRIDKILSKEKLGIRKINKIKNDCPFLDNTKKSKGLTFDLGKMDNSSKLTIYKNPNKRHLHINVKTKDNEQKQFIVEDLDKVIANPIKNRLYTAPAQPKYMNLAQIKDSEIEKYLEFALILTNDFYQYASNYQFTQKRKSLFANLEKYWNNIKKTFNQK